MNEDIPSPIDLKDEVDARRWATESMIKRPYRQEVFQLIADTIKQNKVNSVLELGSGPGYLAKVVRDQNLSVRYTALDNSSAMHELAKKRLGLRADSIEFVLASFLEANWFQDLGLFDAVITVQAVHEIRHKSKTPMLFAQIRQTLKSGGLFLYCDHVCDHNGMTNSELFMSQSEQQRAMLSSFAEIECFVRIGSLALWRGINQEN